ncbi:MAG: hypothetical protein N2422_08405 [Rhodobacteraceae bacterium]|nr:hypothetical protein [Paracoccaceae bacterium]
MNLTVAAGTILTLAGLAILVWCMAAARAAHRAGLADAELRARMQRLVAWNFGALFLSAAGLILVVIGLALA